MVFVRFKLWQLVQLHNIHGFRKLPGQTSRNGGVGKIKPTGFNNAWFYPAWLSMAHLSDYVYYKQILSDKSNFHFSFQIGSYADF